MSQERRNYTNEVDLPYIKILQGRDGRDGRDGEPGLRGPAGSDGVNRTRGETLDHRDLLDPGVVGSLM